MKMLNYFRTMILIMVKTFPRILIALLILPLLFAFINGYSQSYNNVEKKVYPKNSLYIDGKDNKYGIALSNGLKNPEISKYIDLVDNKNDADFILEIDEGFTDSIKMRKLEKLYLKTNSRSASNRVGLLMTSIIESILRTEIQNNLIEEAIISNPNLDIDILNNTIKKATSEPLNTKTEFVETKTIRNSYEKASLNSISFLIFIWISNLIAVHGNKQFEGFYKRMASMPVKPSKVYLVDYIGNTISFAMVFVVYIIIFRQLGWGFDGNIIHLLTAVMVTSMLATSIGSLISEIVPKTISNVIVSILIMIVALTSSLEQIIMSMEKPNPIFKFIKDIAINERIYTLFETVDAGAGISAISNEVLIGLAVTIVFVIIGSIYVDMRKDVKI